MFAHRNVVNSPVNPMCMKPDGRQTLGVVLQYDDFLLPIGRCS